MELINFDDFQQNQRMYGGTAGRKMGITYNLILVIPIVLFVNTLVQRYMNWLDYLFTIQFWEQEMGKL